MPAAGRGGRTGRFCFILAVFRSLVRISVPHSPFLRILWRPSSVPGDVGRRSGKPRRCRNWATSGALTTVSKGLCARAVVILDGDNRVFYTEQVPEIGQEPDYDAALAVL